MGQPLVVDEGHRFISAKNMREVQSTRGLAVLLTHFVIHYASIK